MINLTGNAARGIGVSSVRANAAVCSREPGFAGTNSGLGVAAFSDGTDGVTLAF